MRRCSEHMAWNNSIRGGSYLEYWDVATQKPFVMSLLENIANSLDEASVEYETLVAWMVAYNDVSYQFEVAPEDFASNAWGTYLEAIADSGWYFSTSELLLCARLRESNLVITTYHNRRFTVVGSNISDPASDEIVSEVGG